MEEQQGPGDAASRPMRWQYQMRSLEPRDRKKQPLPVVRQPAEGQKPRRANSPWEGTAPSAETSLLPTVVQKGESSSGLPATHGVAREWCLLGKGPDINILMPQAVGYGLEPVGFRGCCGANACRPQG